MAKYFTLILSLLFVGHVSAQMVLLEEDFSSGIPSNWTIVNADGLTPDDAVSQFTDGWIYYESEDDSSAASTSFYNPVGQSMDYLILPKLDLLSFSKLVWSARSVDASYPDGYYVLVSTTDSLVESFTDTLLTIDAENFIWEKRGLLLDTAGYANQEIFIAFQNFTNDGFILELDDIKVLSDDNVSIPENKENTIVVYPNPTQEYLYVQHDFTESPNFQIFDLNGRMILESSNPQIYVADLQSGIYILNLEQEGTSIKKRFIKE